MEPLVVIKGLLQPISSTQEDGQMSTACVTQKIAKLDYKRISNVRLEKEKKRNPIVIELVLTGFHY